jgi:hypothetical protein
MDANRTVVIGILAGIKTTNRGNGTSQKNDLSGIANATHKAWVKIRTFVGYCPGFPPALTTP